MGPLNVTFLYTQI